MANENKHRKKNKTKTRVVLKQQTKANFVRNFKNEKLSKALIIHASVTHNSDRLT